MGGIRGGIATPNPLPISYSVFVLGSALLAPHADGDATRHVPNTSDARVKRRVSNGRVLSRSRLHTHSARNRFCHRQTAVLVSLISARQVTQWNCGRAPVIAAAVLLWVADRRICLCDHGHRRDGAHGVFALAASSDRRIRMGSGSGCWHFLPWLPVLTASPSTYGM